MKTLLHNNNEIEVTMGFILVESYIICKLIMCVEVYKLE